MAERLYDSNIYEVPIDERDLLDIDTVHDFLRVMLDFPDYYGKNLAALSDCLGDVDRPTRLYVMRDAALAPDSDYARQMDRMCMVFLRAARENPALSVSISTIHWPK